MIRKLMTSLVATLMLPALVIAQEGVQRKSLRSDNPNNSRSTASRKDSARVMKKGDKNNKMGTSVKPASKKMAKNRADQ